MACVVTSMTESFECVDSESKTSPTQFSLFTQIGQISRLSRDSGVSSDEAKRYLSIDEVLSRSQTEGSQTGTVVQDVATQAADPADIGEDEFPKNRKNGESPILARAAVKAIDLH